MPAAVWKYPFAIDDSVTLMLPRGAVLRHAGLDPATGRLAVWAEVDPQAEREERTLRVVETGHPIDFPTSEFLGTVHVYELVSPRCRSCGLPIIRSGWCTGGHAPDESGAGLPQAVRHA